MKVFSMCASTFTDSALSQTYRQQCIESYIKRAKQHINKHNRTLNIWSGMCVLSTASYHNRIEVCIESISFIEDDLTLSTYKIQCMVLHYL